MTNHNGGWGDLATLENIMKFTLDELELLLRCFRATISTMTAFNKDTAALEKLMEVFAVEQSKMMREEYK